MANQNIIKRDPVKKETTEIERIPDPLISKE